MARIAEEVEHIDLLVPPVGLEGFYDGLRGEALVDEKGQRGAVEGEAFRLAGPVKKGAAYGLESFRCGLASSRFSASTICLIKASPASRAAFPPSQSRAGEREES